MTLALSVITVLSLAATGALLFYLVRVLATERERSEARVAALAEAIHAENPPAPGAAPFEPAGAFGPSLARPLFSETAETEAPGTRRWTAVMMAAGGLAALVAVVLLSGGRTGPTAAGLTPDEASPAPTQGGASAEPPLELLSLRHARDSRSLTVSGLIRNPAGAARRADTDAVVFTFDRAGTLITSVRSALADTELRGGAESPFSVVIPGGAQVNRYRISFRTGSQVLPHVDRRR